jgi:hypothetical protein
MLLKVSADLVLRRPICSTASSRNAADILLGLCIDCVSCAAYFTSAVDPWHRLDLVQRMLVALQSPRRSEEET